MGYKNILITGASGTLGRALKLKLSGRKILAPERMELDITDKSKVEKYFSENKIDAIIHCAAMARVGECEENPPVAIKTNIIGTANLVSETLSRNIRFVYISTDYVYPGTRGRYKEDDETIPFTVYGWTKLGGESAVRALNNYCIIRTTFLDPSKIKFDDAPFNAYRSTISLEEVVEAIISLLDSNLKGVINVGQERKSMYEIWKNFKPSIKQVDINLLNKDGLLAVDSSMDVSLWKSFNNKYK